MLGVTALRFQDGSAQTRRSRSITAPRSRFRESSVLFSRLPDRMLSLRLSSQRLVHLLHRFLLRLRLTALLRVNPRNSAQTNTELQRRRKSGPPAHCRRSQRWPLLCRSRRVLCRNRAARKRPRRTQSAQRASSRSITRRRRHPVSTRILLSLPPARVQQVLCRLQTRRIILFPLTPPGGIRARRTKWKPVMGKIAQAKSLV